MSNHPRKYRLAASLALILSAVTAATPVFAQVYYDERVIHHGPPPMRREMVPPPPGPPAFWIWQPGSWRWDGRGYVWYPGGWRHRPHPHAAWIEPHWEHRGGGWVYHQGHWD